MLSASSTSLLYPNPIKEGIYRRPVDPPPSRFRSLPAISLTISNVFDAFDRRLNDEYVYIHILSWIDYALFFYQKFGGLFICDCLSKHSWELLLSTLVKYCYLTKLHLLYIHPNSIQMKIIRLEVHALLNYITFMIVTSQS